MRRVVRKTVLKLPKTRHNRKTALDQQCATQERSSFSSVHSLHYVPGSESSIESADGVGVRVEMVGIFGHYSRNSCEDSETASKSRDDARSVRKRGLFRPRFRHHRRNERRELLRSLAIRLFTVIFTVTG